MEPHERTDGILAAVELERERQRKLLEAKQLPTDMADICQDDCVKLGVLVEEVGEVARALNDSNETYGGIETLISLRTELIQLAAVAVGWAEAIDELLDFLKIDQGELFAKTSETS